MGCEPAGFEYMYVGLQLTPKLWANTPVLGACWLAALTGALAAHFAIHDGISEQGYAVLG